MKKVLPIVIASLCISTPALADSIQGNGNETGQNAYGQNIIQKNKTIQQNDNSRKFSDDINNINSTSSGSRSDSGAFSNSESFSNSGAASQSDGNVGNSIIDQSENKSDYDNRAFYAPDNIAPEKRGYTFGLSTPNGYNLSVSCPTGGTSFNVGSFLGGFGVANSSTKMPTECKENLGSLHHAYGHSILMESVGGLGEYEKQHARCVARSWALEKAYGVEVSKSACLLGQKKAPKKPKFTLPELPPLPPLEIPVAPPVTPEADLNG